MKTRELTDAQKADRYVQYIQLGNEPIIFRQFSMVMDFITNEDFKTFGKTTCPDCGTENREGSKFCKKCGIKITPNELAMKRPLRGLALKALMKKINKIIKVFSEVLE